MVSRTILCGAVVLALPILALAQDPVAVDPEHHKVEFENAHVRVLRIDFPSGAMSAMHQHPCSVAVGLDDTRLVFHLPDGTEREVPLNAREVRAVKPTTHQPENRSGKRVEVILVELKDGGC